jgi:hypothetical protein
MVVGAPRRLFYGALGAGAPARDYPYTLHGSADPGPI